MADEASCGAKDNPSATAGGVILIVPLPRELRQGRTVAGAVANIEEALQRTEGNLAGPTLKGEMCLFDEIEEVIVPDIHLDDAPATGNALARAATFAISRSPKATSATAPDCRRQH